MIEAAGPLLTQHPTLVAWGEAITAVIAVVSLWWAAQYAKPKKNNEIEHTPERHAGDRRMSRVESQVGAARVCNPGRRSTDRCAFCPRDERCERYPLVERTAEMEQRDAELVAKLEEKRKTGHIRSTVVVVEDHDVVLQVTMALLEQVGIRNRGAHSCEEALPVQPTDDILVADWNLPDGTALDLISAFRDANADTPIIVTSAMDQAPENLPDDCVWLPKPFDPDYFLALVRRMRARR